MKTMKKLFALVLAVMMVMSLATTAFAASITIDDGTITGATYQAYKLLNATDGGDGKFAYTINSKYAAVLAEVTGKTTDADVVAYIDAVEDINAFANAVYAAIVKAGLEEDYETTTNEFTNVNQGYYLIVESALGTTETGATDTYSLLMLDTAGNDAVTVTTKEDLPTVEKKVQEKNDSTGTSSWGDSADYDIGDEINYEITGTVSDKYASYKSYYYSFSDTMDSGLSLKTESDPADYTDSIKVTVDGTDVTEQFTITATEHGFTATANLKELTDVTVTAGSKIVVTYTAILNENAVVGGKGNENRVTLEYENDPKSECDGDPESPEKPEEPGKTPEDVNVVFTFEAIVNKVDKDNNPLEGAGFTLYKWNAETNDWVVVKVIASAEDLTTFTFTGLDVGKYKLEETTVPDGYNKVADIEFEVVAEYDNTTDPHTLTGLVVKDADGNVISVDDPETEENEAQFSATVSSGEVSTNVVNLSGTELPSTGGIGTTLFYIIGGILVLAAVVLLVTKRRMNYAE